MLEHLKTISVTQAAEATGIPAKTIRRMLERGDIAGNRAGGKVWRVSVASLEAWVNTKAGAEKPSADHVRHFPEVEDRFS